MLKPKLLDEVRHVARLKTSQLRHRELLGHTHALHLIPSLARWILSPLSVNKSETARV
jgi:hypothetical protein